MKRFLSLCLAIVLVLPLGNIGTSAAPVPDTDHYLHDIDDEISATSDIRNGRMLVMFVETSSPEAKEAAINYYANHPNFEIIRTSPLYVGYNPPDTVLVRIGESFRLEMKSFSGNPTDNNDWTWQIDPDYASSHKPMLASISACTYVADKGVYVNTLTGGKQSEAQYENITAEVDDKTKPVLDADGKVQYYPDGQIIYEKIQITFEVLAGYTLSELVATNKSTSKTVSYQVLVLPPYYYAQRVQIDDIDAIEIVNDKSYTIDEYVEEFGDLNLIYDTSGAYEYDVHYATGTTPVLYVGDNKKRDVTATVFPEYATEKGVFWGDNNDNVLIVTTNEDGNGGQIWSNVILDDSVSHIETGVWVTTICTGKNPPYTNYRDYRVVRVVRSAKEVQIYEAGGEEILENFTLHVYEQIALEAKVLPDNTFELWKQVHWYSDDEEVAVVDKETGIVTAKGPGTTKIWAETVEPEDPSKSYVEVTVPVRAGNIYLNHNNLLLPYGQKEELVVSFYPENVTNQQIEWTSSDQTVVSVNSSGQIVGMQLGKAIITAKLDEENFDSCLVEVINPVTGISLNVDQLEITAKTTGILTATITPFGKESSAASIRDVSWTSSDPTIAKVTSSLTQAEMTNGTTTIGITGLKSGTVTITAKTVQGELVATCEVTVIENVTGISLNKNQISLGVSGTETLYATVYPVTATNRNFKWISSNNNIATVDDSGNVTAVARGVAYIIAATEDGEYRATCVVSVIEPVTAIKIDQTEKELYVGESVALHATTEPYDASNTAVTWYTSNPSVATVNYQGIVTAHNTGTVTITAASAENSKITATVSFTVKTVAVTDVSLDPPVLQLGIGEYAVLNKTIAPDNAANKEVKWSSSDTKIATVSSGGRVTGVGGGTATITVTTVDGGKTASCAVTVNAVSVLSVLLDKQTLTLELGKTEKLTASIVPLTASNQKLTWSSSNTAVVYVDQTGNLTGGMEGIAIVSATTEDGSKSAQCTVTVVKAVALEKVELKTNVKLSPENSETLIPVFTPSTATNKKVTWTSSDSKIASVDENGKVTAVDEGKAIITVTTDEGKKTATCEIIVEIIGNAAKNAINKMLSGSFEKNSAAALEFISGYVENEIEKSAVQTVTGATVTLNNSSELQDVVKQANEVKQVVTESLRLSGLTLVRELRTGMTINSAQSNKTTIVVTSAATNLDVDYITVKLGEYSLILTKKMIKDSTSDGKDLRITLENLTGLSQRQVRVDVDKTLTEPIRLLSTPLSGSADYQTMIDSSGKEVITYYNVSRNKNETLLTGSGTYKLITNTKSFTDMTDKSIEMQEAVKVLAAKGIVNGKTATEFDPDGKITRAEIAALVVRMLGKTNSGVTNEFSDVKSTDWFYTVVHAANNAKYMEGVGGGKFSPNVTIPKAQIITIAARILTNEKSFAPVNASYLDKYTDKASIPSWASGYVAMAVKYNLAPDTGNKFAPDEAMNRGETAIIIYRLFKLLG